jgi:hypothetical protein
MASDMEVQIFSMSLMSVAVAKAMVDGGWIDGIGTSGDAFGCWEEGAKGLGSIGCV